MARKRSRQHERAAERSAAAPEALVARARDWPLAVIAMTGMALTAYLSFTAWTHGRLAYCAVGSSCDAVQGSRWSTLLGVPMATWGFVTYAGVTATAVFVTRAAVRWRAATLLTTAGLAVSLYLTAVSIWEIEAFCVYCLTSLALLAGAWLLTWRPVAGFSKGTWRAGSATLAGVLVVLLHLHYDGAFDPAAGPEDPYLGALAEHLKQDGAAFYGAYWCPHCQQQKAAFGAAARRLPYVECSPHGRRAPRATVCAAQGINNYPTWIIHGRRLERTLSPRELARLTGFGAPPAQTAR